MRIDLNFRSAVQRLTELAGDGLPPHIQVDAACKLVSILSPRNPNLAAVMRALRPDHAESGDDDEPADPDGGSPPSAPRRRGGRLSASPSAWRRGERGRG